MSMDHSGLWQLIMILETDILLLLLDYHILVGLGHMQYVFYVLCGQILATFLEAISSLKCVGEILCVSMMTTL